MLVRWFTAVNQNFQQRKREHRLEWIELVVARINAFYRWGRGKVLQIEAIWRCVTGV